MRLAIRNEEYPQKRQVKSYQQRREREERSLQGDKGLQDYVRKEIAFKLEPGGLEVVSIRIKYVQYFRVLETAPYSGSYVTVPLRHKPQ